MTANAHKRTNRVRRSGGREAGAVLAAALLTLEACAGHRAAVAPVPSFAPAASVAGAVNSVSNEVFPMLSPDGLSLYFASDRPGSLAVDGATGFEALDLYVARRGDRESAWQPPRHLPPPLNTHRADHSVAFSGDGHWLYFASTRPGGCGGHDIYRTWRDDVHDDFAWQPPENLGCTVNGAADDSCPFLVTDPATGTTRLYFVSKREGGAGSWDIYVSRFDPAGGRFGEATPVADINSVSFDGHFDPDHGLLWSGDGRGLGGGDLWFTRRDARGRWRAPINLGPPVNTAANEGCFTVSRDGTELVFASDRPGGAGGYDLFASERRRP